MYVSRHTHAELKLVKLAVLLALALMLVGLAASIANGATRSRVDVPPPNASRQVDDVNTILSSPDATVNEDLWQSESLATDLWLVINRHENAEYDRAIAEWNSMRLPRHLRPWRNTAIASAMIHMGDLRGAEQSLADAIDVAPRNPVARYLLGVVRVHQAREAIEWPDIVGPIERIYVSTSPSSIVPNSRGMLELAAIQEFEAALKYAAELDYDQTMCMIDWSAAERTAMPVVPPTVGQLSDAIDAANYAGKSHLALAQLRLRRTDFEYTEFHLDQARDYGVPTGRTYMVLGNAYEEEGRMQDAARTYFKAVGTDTGLVTPLREAVRTIGGLLFE
ncbi:MAG: tetratricopeptide (TPR) repeat protein [Pirellulaceae bacterium]|jgi:tetratricopeptide (TPR) repeat protein